MINQGSNQGCSGNTWYGPTDRDIEPGPSFHAIGGPASYSQSHNYSSDMTSNSTLEYQVVPSAPEPTATTARFTPSVVPNNNGRHSSRDQSSRLRPGSHFSLSDEISHPNRAVQHIWRQTGSISTTKSLSHLISHVFINNVTTFFCGWNNCGHPVGFLHKAQLITHIRSVHLQEKPFQCTTCGTAFSRKQEAIRHVNAINTGKKYKCSFW
ncbi:hypothetical protein JB92DRAFT_288935 [Gautieria morchelliformis]|nr:hypothetical protein JB92DRAFT_288935 [Gautieria morchelliformis]